jgi:hypothetical protein
LASEPIVNTIVQAVAGVSNQQQIAMTQSANLAIQASNTTNELLAAILNRTATAGNIGREVAVNSVTYK